ncbi:DUF4181 domain-containing protein [Terribacillus sp. DMT04]|uniref:DUF4181 domain-containing protein n=1 Tax=Terribacillus sp. DMT04 TaxID=2850441 RepID=UPI001C2C6C51|nr:DUF4181 domain-containing protein [Terribacillus sp. DMT04]QXE02083.1 DUF4181 domain-containing protein [Terribacillus sp. DMT04]
MNYGIEPDFWIRFFLLLAAILLLLISFHALMRKWFRVERSKFFSYNHVNAKHKKIDWILRITTIVMILLFTPVVMMTGIDNLNLFIYPSSILIIFIIVSELVRTVMERKYAKNPNAYKVTLSQLIFLCLLLLTLYTTDFWGLI